MSKKKPRLFLLLCLILCQNLQNICFRLSKLKIGIPDKKNLFTTLKLLFPHPLLECYAHWYLPHVNDVSRHIPDTRQRDKTGAAIHQYLHTVTLLPILPPPLPPSNRNTLGKHCQYVREVKDCSLRTSGFFRLFSIPLPSTPQQQMSPPPPTLGSDVTLNLVGVLVIV